MSDHRVQRPSRSQVWAAIDWLKSHEAGDGDPVSKDLRAVADWLAAEEAKRLIRTRADA